MTLSCLFGMIIIGQSRLLEDGLVLTSSLSSYRYEQSCSQNPNVIAKGRGIVSTFLYLGKYVICRHPQKEILTCFIVSVFVKGEGRYISGCHCRTSNCAT